MKVKTKHKIGDEVFVTFCPDKVKIINVGVMQDLSICYKAESGIIFMDEHIVEPPKVEETISYNPNWKPEIGGKYWGIRFAQLICDYYKYNDDDIDKNQYNSNNMFQTKEIAQSQLEKRLLIAEVERWIYNANDGEEPYDGKTVYYACYSFNDKKEYDFFSSFKWTYRFFTKQKAEEFGDLFYDKLLKYDLI